MAIGFSRDSDNDGGRIQIETDDNEISMVLRKGKEREDIQKACDLAMSMLPEKESDRDGR